MILSNYLLQFHSTVDFNFAFSRLQFSDFGDLYAYVREDSQINFVTRNVPRTLGGGGWFCPGRFFCHIDFQAHKTWFTAEELSSKVSN